MATSKSARYPFQWSNGTWHSKPQSLLGTTPQNPLGKGFGQAPGPPPPPPGTYAREVDYNASASRRGWEVLQDDAATRHEQGTEDRDSLVARLARDETRLGEDYARGTADLTRHYGILGNQQGERFAQFGDASQGLAAQSQGIRQANQGREQTLLDSMRDRGVQDIGTHRGLLQRDYDREFAGYQPGMQIKEGFTPAPGAGSLLNSLYRGWRENDAFQTLSAGQRTDQAAQFGYRTPTLAPRTAAQDRYHARKYAARGPGVHPRWGA